MNLTELLILSFVLTLDAFLISIPMGINKHISTVRKLYFPISFFVFSFLFTIVGNVLSDEIFHGFERVLDVIGGLILAYLGVKMILEGRKIKKDITSTIADISIITIIMYAISGSMDSFVVGFSQLQNVSFLHVVLDSFIISFISATLSCLGLWVGNTLKNVVVIERYADEIGGFVLLAFGLFSAVGIV